MIKHGYVSNDQRKHFAFTQAEANRLIEEHPMRDELERWSELLEQMDYDECMEACLDEITEVTLANVANAPWRHATMSNDEREALSERDWEDLRATHAPRCDLVFTVANPALLRHLRPGCSWETAMRGF